MAMKKVLQKANMLAKYEYVRMEELVSMAEAYFSINMPCVPLIIEIEEEETKLIPAFRWKGLRTFEEFMKRWKDTPLSKRLKAVGLALITGEVSNTTVLDIDNLIRFSEKTGIEIEKLKHETLAQETKNKGLHLFFQYEKDLPSIQDREKGFDIKNDNSLVNICPTRIYYIDLMGQTKKRNYTWLNYKKPIKMPEKLKKFLLQYRKERPEAIKQENKNKSICFDELLAEEIGNLYRQGLIEGFTHIDCSLMAGLIESGYAEEEIHKLWEIIYKEEYDERLTSYMMRRNQSLERKIGIGTLFKKLKEIGRGDIIRRMKNEDSYLLRTEH